MQGDTARIEEEWVGGLDRNGDIWVPSKPGESHGGPHWDVQIRGGKGGHRNVYPDK